MRRSFEQRAIGATRLEARRNGRIGADLVRAVREIEAVTIAAVERRTRWRRCIATACDFRIAGEGAFCGYPEVNLGMNLQGRPCPACVSWARHAQAHDRPRPQARHRGTRALGLLDEVTPAGGALDAALALAEECATNRRWRCR